MTDQELKDLVAGNSKAIDKLHEELGWIGNRFGRFTEGLFLPSLERILLEDFGLEATAPRIKKRRNGSEMELDMLGYSNGKNNTAVVVEIKSTLRDGDIRRFLETLKKFPKFFPEHKEKKILAMMAAASFSAEQKARLERLGIYVVRINDDVFRVVSSKKFEPKDFGLKA